MPPFCTKCRDFDIHEALHRHKHESAEGEGPDGEHWSLSTTWHERLKDVHRSAQICALCALVMKGWRESRLMVIEDNIIDATFNPEDPPADLHDDIVDIPGYADEGAISLHLFREEKATDDGRGIPHSLLLIFGCSYGGLVMSFQAHGGLTVEFRIARDEAGPTGADDDVALDQIVHPDPLSTQSLKIAKTWLHTCVETHGEMCGGGAPPSEQSRWLPSRLIDVSAPGNHVYLRSLESLYQVQTDKVKYQVPTDEIEAASHFVALSHCWGRDGTPFTTTRGTLDQRKRGIYIKEMPQTFQDAIAVVRALGVPYIWIDSLCIIQDDAEDWYVESGAMASIYRGAYFVLGAARGVSDAMGFLGRRERRDIVEVPSRQSSNTSLLHLQLLPPPNQRWTHQGGPDPLKNEPLSSRAWCLQERALPRRSLQYLADQMIWECGRLRASEQGEAVSQSGSHVERLCQTANIGSSVFHRTNRQTSSERDSANWADWYAMVQDYTARAITKNIDRLPALSGIATAVGAAAKDEYVAGIWKSGLIEGMMWCRTNRDQMLHSPQEFIAPSWSWASVVGPVHFPMYSWYSRAYWKAKMSDFEPLARYVSHDTKIEGLDPNGRLKGGELRLKAPLLRITAVRDRPLRPPLRSHIFGQEPTTSPFTDKLLCLQQRTGVGNKDLLVDGGFDEPPDSAAAAGSRLFVLLLTQLPHVFEDGFLLHLFGLIVEEDRDASTVVFRRVGFVDGLVLERRGNPATRWLRKIAGNSGGNSDDSKYGNVGYERRSRDGDVDDTERPNDLAHDPLKLQPVEVVLR